jgi:hypothetical protein
LAVTPETLEAGRRLDALVAEKVMGWRLILWEANILPPDADMPHGIPPVGHGTWVPRYSTNIAAAWQIVDRLLAQDYGVTMTMDDPHNICVEVWGGLLGLTEERGATDRSAPLAICRAALATLER